MYYNGYGYFGPNYAVYQNIVNGTVPKPIEVNIDIPEGMMKITPVDDPNTAGPSETLDFNKAILPDNPKDNDVNQEVINPDFSNLIGGTRVANEITEKFGICPVENPEAVNVNPKMDIVPANPPLINNPMEGLLPTRKVNNWFSRMIEQRGEDFLNGNKMSIDEVSRNADRIIDEMIAGKVDYSKYGKYIVNHVVIDTLIDFCANKINLNSANLYTQNYFYSDYLNRMQFANDTERFIILSTTDNMVRNIVRSMSMCERDIAIYSILYSKFKAVKNTGNALLLINLTSELNNYRKLYKK